ncbi:sensor histidine kinase [Nonomuraea diastatica]|nr:histidine kinase [Nonomuraea diastatica]
MVLGLCQVRRWVALILAVIALVSASVSVVHGYRGGGAGAWSYIETLALLLMVMVVARNSPVRHATAAGLVGGLAESLLILRLVPASSLLEAAGLCAFWGLGAVGAAAIGTHLRWLDSERVRSVTDARRGQRLVLARDLHDFIAHDLGEMVIQAQVGQVAPGREGEALRHIELIGQRALASLSATVRALHELDDGSGADAAAPDLGDLPRIVEGFAAAGTVPVTLHVEPGLEGRLPRRVSTTVARIVIEALSNVRRHMPDAEFAEVKVVGDGQNVVASVINGPGRRAPVSAPTTRVGLVALEERVRSLGGRFTAGPRAHGGWQMVAEIPADTLPADG